MNYSMKTFLLIILFFTINTSDTEPLIKKCKKISINRHNESDLKIMRFSKNSKKKFKKCKYKDLLDKYEIIGRRFCILKSENHQKNVFYGKLYFDIATKYADYIVKSKDEILSQINPAFQNMAVILMLCFLESKTKFNGCLKTKVINICNGIYRIFFFPKIFESQDYFENKKILASSQSHSCNDTSRFVKTYDTYEKELDKILKIHDIKETIDKVERKQYILNFINPKSSNLYEYIYSMYHILDYGSPDIIFIHYYLNSYLKAWVKTDIQSLNDKICKVFKICCKRKITLEEIYIIILEFATKNQTPAKKFIYIDSICTKNVFSLLFYILEKLKLRQENTKYDDTVEAIKYRYICMLHY